MIARLANRSLLAALLLGLVAALLLAVLPRLPDRVVVRAGDIGPLLAEGETPAIRSFYGFNQVETSGDTRFRWTDGTGNFVVRAGQRMGAPLVLRMRLCGCRAGPDAMTRLELRVNGAPLADIAASAEQAGWRRYALLVSPQETAYSPDLLVELLSDTIKNPQFGYPMGVALDTVEIGPALPQQAYGPGFALVLGLLSAALALICRANDEGPRANEHAGETSIVDRRSSFVYRQPAIVVALVFALVAAQGVLYRHQAFAAEVLALALLAALALALLARATPAVTCVLALLLGALVVAPQALGAWMLDDAYISFRYAHNALAGYGLVFNPGERVEGYTNFLWTVLFMPVLSAGLNPALASQAITLLLALATAALTWLGARRQGGPLAATAALALLASSAPFVLYTARGSGMETALFTLLVLSGALAYLAIDHQSRETGDTRQEIFARPSRVSRLLYPASRASVSRRSSVVGAVLALAAMARPEGALVAGVCGLHLLAASWRAGRPAWRGLSGLALGFLAVFAPYYLWRLGYYGYPLPNTFYAKVGGSGAQALRGLDYALGFARSQAPLLALALLGVALAYLADRETGDKETGRSVSLQSPCLLVSLSSVPSAVRRPSSVVRRPSSFLWLLVGVYTLYIVAVGGDHFPFYRFFVPLLPPLALLAAEGIARIGRALPAAPAAALAAAVAVGWQAPQLYASRTLNGEERVWSENSVVEKNREIGLWLGAHTLPGTLLATGIAGAMPYYAERPTLDTLGLNDLHIAHLDVPTIGQGVAGAEKTDNDYILRRGPAYIPYSSAGALLEHPLFLQLYDRGIVHGPEGRWLRLYKRHDIPPPAGWAPIDDQ